MKKNKIETWYCHDCHAEFFWYDNVDETVHCQSCLGSNIEFVTSKEIPNEE